MDISSALKLGPDNGYGILSKLAKINASISGYVSKDKKNKDQGYTYVTEAQFLATIRPELVAQNVVFAPLGISDVSIVQKTRPFNKVADAVHTETSMIIEHATVKFGFFDSEDGSCLEVSVRASGADQNDKATYKLMTGAAKYALSKSFNLATGDDPEDDRFSEPVDTSDEPVAPKKTPATPKKDDEGVLAPPRNKTAPTAKTPPPVEVEEEEEDAPPPPKKTPAPKAAPAKAKAKKENPFSDEEVVDGVSLAEVYDAIQDVTGTPEDVTAVITPYIAKIKPMSRGKFRKAMNEHIEAKVAELQS